MHPRESLAVGSLPGLDPGYLAAKERLLGGKMSRHPIPKQKYGHTKEKLSIIGFGGMVVKDATPKEADNYVAEAVDRGVNYFDSILFPLSFPTWFGSNFGPSVHKRAKKAGIGILALKAMAHRAWPRGKKHRWNKTFYEPFDEIDHAALGLRFTLHLPVTAMIPPGHWELFRMALDLAKARALIRLNRKERTLIKQIADGVETIFP